MSFNLFPSLWRLFYFLTQQKSLLIFCNTTQIQHEQTNLMINFFVFLFMCHTNPEDESIFDCVKKQSSSLWQLTGISCTKCAKKKQPKNSYTWMFYVLKWSQMFPTMLYWKCSNLKYQCVHLVAHPCLAVSPSPSLGGHVSARVPFVCLLCG